MHDISRALQCLIKHASTEQRDAIFEEIKGDLVEMSKNKYAKNFIKRILDKSNKEQREVIISSFASHVPELVGGGTFYDVNVMMIVCRFALTLGGIP